MKKKVLIFFIILILVFIVYISFKCNRGIREFYESFKEYPEIDMVYTWVDYNDLKNEIKGVDLEYKRKRYVQNEELRYSLRSVEKNCPWIRRIYIVVKEGQRPDFLLFSDKIKLVNHKEIMPPSSLPTYNSVAIESCIHKINGLSDFYIYMNDDFFIMKPLYKSDVLSDKPGKYVPYVDKANPYSYKIGTKDLNSEYSYWTMYNNSLALANKITGQNLLYNMVHLPAFCYKPWDQEIENALRGIKYNKNGSSNLWDYNVNCKFRMNDSVAINCCSRSIYYMDKGGIPINLGQHHMTLNFKKGTCVADGYDLSKVKFLCINEIDDECKDSFKKFITRHFPEKSSFEK